MRVFIDEYDLEWPDGVGNYARDGRHILITHYCLKHWKSGR